jgi:hypothetical protein
MWRLGGDASRRACSESWTRPRKRTELTLIRVGREPLRHAVPASLIGCVVSLARIVGHVGQERAAARAPGVIAQLLDHVEMPAEWSR